MDKLPWVLLLGGVLLFLGGVFFGTSPSTYIPGIIVGVIGALMAMIGFTKLRNKLNRWMDQ